MFVNLLNVSFFMLPFFQIKAKLDQFMQGLNDAGVLDMLQISPQLFQHLSEPLRAGVVDNESIVL